MAANRYEAMRMMMPPGRARDMRPAPRVRTFDEAFAELRITPAERTAMVWHLAALRARKTVEALLPNTKPELLLGFDPKMILRGEQS
jgi:hypothetical protein